MKEYERVEAVCGSLPGTVYYLCVWTVRDLERMEELLESAERQRREVGPADGVIFIGPYPVSQELERTVSERIRCVELALSEIPEAYRGIVTEAVKIRDKKKSPEWAHENTVKIWKRRFIYALAGYMHLV